MSSIGSRLRKLRTERRITQNQISQILGITQQIYSNYEIGKNELPVRHLVVLSDFYGVSTDYLLGLVSYPQIPPELSGTLTQNITTLDFVRRISDFNETSKHRLVEYTNYLIYIENKYKKKTDVPRM